MCVEDIPVVSEVKLLCGCASTASNRVSVCLHWREGGRQTEVRVVISAQPGTWYCHVCRTDLDVMAQEYNDRTRKVTILLSRSIL